jgi:hypothetical protein
MEISRVEVEIFFQKRRGALIYRPLVHLIASFPTAAGQSVDGLYPMPPGAR